jgi:hypothetical protein
MGWRVYFQPITFFQKDETNLKKMFKSGFLSCVLGHLINFFILVYPSFSNPITPYRTLRYEGVIGQTSYYTCGPAAVATLLTHYYSQPTAESEILELSEKAMEGSGKSPEERGVTALALRQALAAKGIQARGMRLTFSILSRLLSQRWTACCFARHQTSNALCFSSRHGRGLGNFSRSIMGTARSTTWRFSK